MQAGKALTFAHALTICWRKQRDTVVSTHEETFKSLEMARNSPWGFSCCSTTGWTVPTSARMKKGGSLCYSSERFKPYFQHFQRGHEWEEHICMCPETKWLRPCNSLCLQKHYSFSFAVSLFERKTPWTNKKFSHNHDASFLDLDDLCSHTSNIGVTSLLFIIVIPHSAW